MNIAWIIPLNLTNPLAWVVTLSAALVSVLTAVYCACHFGGGKKKAAVCFAAVTVVVCILLICFFGLAAITIRGIILCLVLEYSTYSDIKTRLCANWVHVMIVIAAFIGRDVTDLPMMILAGLFTGGIMTITGVITGKPVGGADIKLTAACSFMLGLWGGMIGLLAGTVLALAVNLFRMKHKNEGFPMIPYLAVGFVGAYFLHI